VIDADCGTNARCSANTCRPLCNSDKDCTPLGMLCNVSAGFCVNCIDDSGCKAEEYCSQGACSPDVCVSGSSDCADNSVVTCNTSGSGTLPPVTCAGNQICLESSNAASCVDQVCSPLVKGCSQNGELVVQCADDGLSQSTLEDCGAKSQVCVAAVCKPVVCSAGNKYCAGSEVRQCSAKGDSYIVAATCSSNQYCDGTSGSCKNQICTPNAGACNNAIATTCNANGSGYLTGGIDCASSGQICVSGQCQDLLCAPSTKYCSGNQIRQCSSDGLSDSLVQTCTSTQYCDAATVTCKAQVCTPNQAACDVNVATTCNSDGSGYTGSRKDCTTTSQSCLKGGCVDTPTSCAVILSTGKSSGDGVYLINPTGTQVLEVYCDMTDGGVTYEQLAFGRFDATYAGYTIMGVPDLQNLRVQQAFIWSYNKQGGMKNLDTSFTSSNCCFKGPETGYIAFGTSTNNYIYPADQTGTSYHCNSPAYSSAIMRFSVQGVSNGLAVAPLPTTYFSTGVLASTDCTTSSNPAFFFKRY
jgi:hypothetical protein